MTKISNNHINIYLFLNIYNMYMLHISYNFLLKQDL